MINRKEAQRICDAVSERAAVLSDKALSWALESEDTSDYQILFAAALEVSELELVAMHSIGRVLFSISDPEALEQWVAEGAHE